jgi:hypothetical protein
VPFGRLQQILLRMNQETGRHVMEVSTMLDHCDHRLTIPSCLWGHLPGTAIRRAGHLFLAK